MSQLTFDGFVEKKPEKIEKPERKETWYKGRVLSHSSIGMYRQCPRRWKFRYIDRIPEKPKSFFSFGKSVHAGLEFLFSKAPAFPGLEELVAHYKNNWLREGYESAAQEKWFFQEGDRILRGFYAKHQKDARKTLHVEYKFTFDVEGVPITGFIDRIDETAAGKLHLIDYKTGKAFDKARVRTDPQLTLYQMATRQLLGKEVESLTLYHLNSLTPLTVPAHAPKIEDDLRGTILEAAKGINENKFEPAPDEKGHCQWCDYVQVCPAFTGKKPPVAASSVNEWAAAVDKIGKLDVKIKELAAERALLGASLAQQMAQAGMESAEGEFFKAKRVEESGAANVVSSEKKTDA